MSISKGILEVLEKSSWIRKMFEEGIQLKQQYGEKNVFDLSLGNPLLEPPKKFKERIFTKKEIKSCEKIKNKFACYAKNLPLKRHLQKHLALEYQMV